MLVGPIDLTIIVVYFGVVLAIGCVSMRKTRSFEDYAVAGRRLPIAFLFATMAATATGGAATIGRASQSYQSGIVIFIATIGFVAKQLLSGLFLAPRIRAIGKLYTVGDVIGFYYGRVAHALTGIFSFLYSVSLFGVQLLAMGRILETITGLPLLPLTIAGAAITILYTGLGRMWAVIYTDLLQFIVLAFGITTAAVVALLWGAPTERRVSPSSAAPAIVTGIVTTFLWSTVVEEPLGIPAVVAGVAANLLVLFLVHGVTVRR